MPVRFEENTLFVSGCLDGKFPFEEARKLLASSAGGENQVVNLDLSALERSNSTGVLEWIRLLRESKNRFQYVHAPIWLVEQFTDIEEFLSTQISVKTFYARFYCPTEDSFEVVLLEVGKDVPLLPDYSTFELSPKCAGGHKMEPDFIPGDYFDFLRCLHRLQGGRS